MIKAKQMEKFVDHGSNESISGWFVRGIIKLIIAAIMFHFLPIINDRAGLRSKLKNHPLKSAEREKLNICVKIHKHKKIIMITTEKCTTLRITWI